MVETTSNKILYQVGESRVFPFPIRFIAPSDVHCFVNVNGVERELVASEFSVERKDDYSDGANVTLNIDPLPTGATLAIVRQCDPVQFVSFPINGKFPSKSNENALDKLTMLVQDLVEKVSRCIKSLVTQTTFSVDELISMISNSVALAAAAADEAKNAAYQADKVLAEAASAAEQAASAAEQAASAADLKTADELFSGNGKCHSEVKLLFGQIALFCQIKFDLGKRTAHYPAEVVPGFFRAFSVVEDGGDHRFQNGDLRTEHFHRSP